MTQVNCLHFSLLSSSEFLSFETISFKSSNFKENTPKCKKHLFNSKLKYSLKQVSVTTLLTSKEIGIPTFLTNLDLTQDHKYYKNSYTKVSEAKSGSWKCLTETRTYTISYLFFSNAFPMIQPKELTNGDILRDIVRWLLLC